MKEKELKKMSKNLPIWGGYWKWMLWCISKYVPTDLHIGIWFHLLFHIYSFLFPVNRWSSQGFETWRHWVNLLKTIGQLTVVTTANQLPYFGAGCWGYVSISLGLELIIVAHLVLLRCFPTVSNPMCTLHYGLEGHVFSSVIPVQCILKKVTSNQRRHFVFHRCL